MASLSEMSEILLAHPAVTRADTTDVGGPVIAVVGVREYVSGVLLRDHVFERLGADCGLAGVLPVEGTPVVDAAYVAAAVEDGRCALFEGPRDDVERRLVDIWAQALDTRFVGVLDDFLELGGDSLSALSAIDAIEAEFGRSVDAYDFTDAGCVRRLADLLRVTQPAGA